MSSSGSNKRQRPKYLPAARCTEEEHTAIGAMARGRGVSVSQFVREAALQRSSPGPKPRRRAPAADEQQLARILAQLGKWGSNLNQLAHAANMDEPVSRTQFEELAGPVREAVAAVREAVGRDYQG